LNIFEFLRDKVFVKLSTLKNATAYVILEQA